MTDSTEKKSCAVARSPKALYDQGGDRAVHAHHVPVGAAVTVTVPGCLLCEPARPSVEPTKSYSLASAAKKFAPDCLRRHR